jgi:S1-C subfamily serine protease
VLFTLLVAALVSIHAHPLPQPGTAVLHITVTVADAAGNATPVPRHALLISDNPATAEPRQILTRLDGTVDVTLRAGSYIIESDRPVVFHGTAYRWTQTVDIAAGRNAALALTTANAEVEAATATPGSADDDAAFLLPQLNESVVGLWTPTTHASGVLVDANGLIVTNQRVVGTATVVEVQLSPSVKVPAQVLVADTAKDVAVLWMDAATARSLRPAPLSCDQPPAAPMAVGQALVAIGVSQLQEKEIISATVGAIEADAIASDLTPAAGSLGGPVFTTRGEFVGITSTVPETAANARRDTRVVQRRDVCDVVRTASRTMAQAAPPSATHLPVEPVKPFPTQVLAEATARRAGSLNPYVVPGAAFEAAFITPIATFGTQYQAELLRARSGSGGRQTGDSGRPANPLLEFSNWSDYVGAFPPVLLVRVTPRLTESFWTTVGRIAAMSQGVALPPIKRFRTGFSRLRTYCGDVEVTPIHPFKLERRVSETDAIYEGLYVYDPAALGPHCGSVKLVMYSDKEPDKGDTRVVDPGIVQQVWQDFAPYRALLH